MSRAAVALLLGLGCGGDPVLDPIAEARADYDRGQEALASGDPDAARRAFAEARAHDDQTPTLAAWEAHAAAEAGDVVGALALLDAALGRWPRSADLRFNRAALRARSGDLPGAAEDLRALYSSGLLSPREAAADPDFAPLAAHPDYAVLVPPPRLDVVVTGEAGSVLLGEPWDLDLEVRGPADAALAIGEPSGGAGLLALERVVEEVGPVEAGRRGRQLRFRWRAEAAGVGALGPLTLRAGPATAEVEPQAIEVVALGKRAEPAAPPRWTTLPIPSALGASDPEPTLVRHGEWWVVTAPPSARIAWEGPAAEVRPVALELRREGQTLLQRQVLPVGPAGRVRVTQAGLTLLDRGLE